MLRFIIETLLACGVSALALLGIGPLHYLLVVALVWFPIFGATITRDRHLAFAWSWFAATLGISIALSLIWPAVPLIFAVQHWRESRRE
jgi:hypothetical protein